MKTRQKLSASTCIEYYTHASNHKKPSLPAVSTISTYLWYFIATPLWFVHVLPLKPSKYYHLFCETPSLMVLPLVALLCDIHADMGNTINITFLVERHVSCYACSSCLK